MYRVLSAVGATRYYECFHEYNIKLLHHDFIFIKMIHSNVPTARQYRDTFMLPTRCAYWDMNTTAMVKLGLLLYFSLFSH